MGNKNSNPIVAEHTGRARAVEPVYSGEPMTPEECTTRTEINRTGRICNHPDRDLQNPHGMIYCENLIRYGNCPEGCRS